MYLGFITYKKYNFFWNFFNTRLLRKFLGDSVASNTLYIVSMVLIVTGMLVATGIVQ